MKRGKKLEPAKRQEKHTREKKDTQIHITSYRVSSSSIFPFLVQETNKATLEDQKEQLTLTNHK